MVIYLNSFINNRELCPYGTYKVNIEEEIDKYKSKNPGRTPTIVFDFCGSLCIFIKNNDEILSGGRLYLCQKRVENFLQKLKNMGTDLVFFDDGQIKEEKIPAWLKRVNIKYEEQCDIFEEIKQSKPIDLKKKLQTSFCLYEVFLRIAKNYGECFQSFHNECDRDCAAFATKIKAAAVITLDTDFLIMPGDWPIWVPRTINLESYTITAWNKKALRTALGLNQSQMPIFSILCGNDWTNPRRNTRNKIDKTPIMTKRTYSQLKTAEIIRRRFPEGVPFLRDECLQLAYILHNDDRNFCTMKEAIDMVNTSLRFYRYHDHQIPDIFPKWLKKHTEDTSSNVVFTLVKDCPIFIHQSLIDLSVRDVRPYCALALPIIRKQMGVSDYHKCRENKERIIYLKPSHEEPFQKQTITPIFPDFEIPPLNILLGYDVTEEENASLADKRLEIFCWIISTKRHHITPEVFKTLTNKAYIASILVLTYLVKELQITIDEADVMLLSIYETINASHEKLESFERPEFYDERGFWLAHVFLRLRQLYFDSFLLCGLNEYRQYDSYDGFIFHKMYKKYLLLDSETKRSLRKPIDDYRIYAENML